MLKRGIGETGLTDVTGCYPVCVIDAHADLTRDFAGLHAAGAVSLTLVTDVYFRPDPARLQEMFDLVRPFKTHYLHDYTRARRIASHHRYEVKRAASACDIRVVPYEAHLDEWLTLYRYLVARHGITGIQNLSDHYFHALAKLKNVLAIGAFSDDALISMHLWVEHENVLYSHLAASNDEGYRMRAAYAIHDYVLREYGEERHIDLGGGAGLADDPDDGLARFKKGFSNDAAPCFLCGKIFDAERYERLSEMAAPHGIAGYFPRYRSPSTDAC